MTTEQRYRLFAPWILGAFLAVIGIVAGVRLFERLQPPPLVEPTPLTVHAKVLEPETFERTRQYSGVLDAERRAVLASHLTATILELPHREGTLVREGEMLVRLDDGELLQETRRLEAAARRIEVDLKYWREQLRADERLFKQGMVTERALQDTRRRFHTLEASREENQHALAAAKTRLAYATVNAPMTGYIQRVHLLPGELATPGHPLVEIVASEPLKAVFSVPQRDLSQMQPGLEVRLSVSAFNKAWTGQVDRLYPALDPQSRTATLEAFLPRETGLRPGMNVDAAVQVERTDQALVVEQQAVQWRQGQTGVFVIQDDKAQWRPVHVSEPEGKRVMLLSGVVAGEQVVLTPYPGLSDGSAVNVAGKIEQGAGHVAVERSP